MLFLLRSPIHVHKYIYIVTIYVCDYRRGMDWWMDLLPTLYIARNYMQYSAIADLHTL
jgi:hypothetical protein